MTFHCIVFITYLVNSVGCYVGIIISLCVYWLLAFKKQTNKNQNKLVTGLKFFEG